MRWRRRLQNGNFIGWKCQSNNTYSSQRHEEVPLKGAVTHRPQYGCLIALQLHPKNVRVQHITRLSLSLFSSFFFLALSFSFAQLCVVFSFFCTKAQMNDEGRNPIPSPPITFSILTFLIYFIIFAGVLFPNGVRKREKIETTEEKKKDENS